MLYPIHWAVLLTLHLTYIPNPILPSLSLMGLSHHHLLFGLFPVATSLVSSLHPCSPTVYFQQRRQSDFSPKTVNEIMSFLCPKVFSVMFLSYTQSKSKIGSQLFSELTPSFTSFHRAFMQVCRHASLLLLCILFARILPSAWQSLLTPSSSSSLCLALFLPLNLSLPYDISYNSFNFYIFSLSVPPPPSMILVLWEQQCLPGCILAHPKYPEKILVHSQYLVNISKGMDAAHQE